MAHGKSPINLGSTSSSKVIPKPRRPMQRAGTGTKGQRINLLTNHLKVSTPKSGDFYHYSVTMTYEDDKPVVGKGIGRRVIATMQEIYGLGELAGKALAYDGDKSLFTIGPLPEARSNFVVVLSDMPAPRPIGDVGTSKNESPNDSKRAKPNYGVKTIKVELRYAAKVPIGSILSALQGRETDSTQEALRVLDIVLRQNAAKRGCLLVRQSFFYDQPSSYADLGGSVQGCRGYHSSFRPTKDVLSLNVDVSTTITIKPGPVTDFLVYNQNCRDPGQIDWAKAKRILKNLRVKIYNQEYKIIGLSERICAEQKFTLKPKGDQAGVPEEITVQEYFWKYRRLQLLYSGKLPCVNVGKPKRPTYYPMELCDLVPLQRYKRALTVFQRSSLVEKSRQKPNDRLKSLNDALSICNYDADPFLRECGIRINPNFTKVDGRVLQPPKLKAGNGRDIFANNGRWNFNGKTFIAPAELQNWIVVNFSAQCDVRAIARDLMRCGEMKGMKVQPPRMLIQEEPAMQRQSPANRVQAMIHEVKNRSPTQFVPPSFFLCILAERKNSDIYGPWKKKCLSDLGVKNQCIVPPKAVNDQYLTNVLLKINAKLGGLNSQLHIENIRGIPMVSNIPTLILGMDVSHPAPGRDDVPSIAAVVGSVEWPLISKYRAVVRSQSSRVEMIDALFIPPEQTNGDKKRAGDFGIFSELADDFYKSCGRKPESVIIFRDGVSESQFNQVLNIELDQIIEACKFKNWMPKFTVIIAQKNHYTRFFQDMNSPHNVPPGTVVDTTVCHPSNYDFYMCPHAGMIGTSRPTHYHVLLDENKFTADQLQEFIHSLSYAYQRSTTAISIVAPVLYAHMAAAQVAQFVKFEERSETTSQQGGSTAATNPPAVPELPKLHQSVCSSMFFC